MAGTNTGVSMTPAERASSITAARKLIGRIEKLLTAVQASDAAAGNPWPDDESNGQAELEGLSEVCDYADNMLEDM